MVANAWAMSPAQSNPLRTIDAKLRNVAKALMSWSASNIRSVRLQLTLAREASRKDGLWNVGSLSCVVS
jgi:hypothetical protein